MENLVSGRICCMSQRLCTAFAVYPQYSRCAVATPWQYIRGNSHLFLIVKCFPSAYAAR